MRVCSHFSNLCILSCNVGVQAACSIPSAQYIPALFARARSKPFLHTPIETPLFPASSHPILPPSLPLPTFIPAGGFGKEAINALNSAVRSAIISAQWS